MRQEEEQQPNQSSVPSFNLSGKSLIILYDSIRWEEKALYEAAIKKGVKVENVNCKNLAIDLSDKNSKYSGQVVLQRCISYFKNVHSTGSTSRPRGTSHKPFECSNNVWQ